MGSHIGKGVAFFCPLKCTGGYFERLFQHGQSIEWIADAIGDVVLDAQMVRVVALVHIYRTYQSFFIGEFDHLIGFMY